MSANVLEKLATFVRFSTVFTKRGWVFFNFDSITRWSLSGHIKFWNNRLHVSQEFLLNIYVILGHSFVLYLGGGRLPRNTTAFINLFALWLTIHRNLIKSNGNNSWTAELCKPEYPTTCSIRFGFIVQIFGF